MEIWPVRISAAEWSLVDKDNGDHRRRKTMAGNSEQMPTSVWQGTFRLFGVDVQCHVLSDGRRVIEQESMTNLVKAIADEGTAEMGDLEAFVLWHRGKHLPRPEGD